jgi:hypothetical protein
MGWLSDLWNTFQGAKPTDRLLVPGLRIPEADFLDQPIKDDESYLEIYVESLRLEKARSFATTFNGLVYASVTMARLGEEDLHLTAVSKPESLAKLDSNTVDVITVSRKIIGPVAWRGGTLHLELGLLSVKTGNILTPVIDLVTQISTTAGIAFIGSVQPFIPLMTKGLDLIAGQTKDTAIEVAIDTDLTPSVTAAFAIVDAPKQSINVARLKVDQADKKLLLDGNALNRGYCVFTLRQTDKKADFGLIPELKAKYAVFQKALSNNKKDDAADALTAFRLAALASPDIIRKDALRLAAMAKQSFDDGFPGGIVMKGLVAHKPQELSEIGLYE